MYFHNKSDADTYLRIYAFNIRVWEENVKMDSPAGIRHVAGPVRKGSIMCEILEYNYVDNKRSG